MRASPKHNLSAWPLNILLLVALVISTTALYATQFRPLFALPSPFSWPQMLFLGFSLLLLVLFISLRSRQQLIETHQQALLTLKLEQKAYKRQQEEEAQRLSIVLDSARLAYWEWNIKKNTAFFSELWQEMIGFQQHDFPQDLHAWQSRIHPLDQRQVQTKLHKVLSNQYIHYEDTHRLMNADGDYIWVYDRGQAIYNANQEIERLSCVRIDITEQKKLEQELLLDNILLENTQEAIAITDEHFHFIRTNPAFIQSFGFSSDELETIDLKTLLDNLQDEPPQDILSLTQQQNEWRGELILHQVNGEVARASLVDLQKVIHETTQTTHYTLVYTDITALKRAEQTLNRLANIDLVTGLANRNQFYQSLENRLKLRADQAFTLMYLDLDNFKMVNDTLGHDAGDQLLKSVADLISAEIHTETLFARVGGDEFVILCEHYTEEATLHKIAEKLNQLLSVPFKIGKHSIQIGSSIGIAIYPQHGQDQITLLKNADTAMYEAKRAGKGQFRIFQPEKTPNLLQTP